MTLFSQEKQLSPSNTYKFLASILRDAFTKCRSFPETVSSPEAEEPAADFDEEDDQVFVSAIISQYMESKCRKRALPPVSGYFMINARAMPLQGSCGEEDVSAGSRLSRCSSATSFDTYFSVKTHFSRSSSLNRIDFHDFSSNRSVILEFLQCEGWPFGLCRKALLLPPLPKSPPDPWSWRKGGAMVKING